MSVIYCVFVSLHLLVLVLECVYFVFGLDSGGLLFCPKGICIVDDEATDRTPDKYVLHLHSECVKLCVCICKCAWLCMLYVYPSAK